MVKRYKDTRSMVYRVDSGKKIIIKAWKQNNISKKLYLL